MSVLPSYITAEYMRDLNRGQAMQAYADAFYELAHSVRTREESYVKRSGGAWDPDQARLYQLYLGTAEHFEAMHEGARGVAIEVANANKKGGKEFQKMPAWIDRLGDRLINAFKRPIAKEEHKLHDVRLESLSQGSDEAMVRVHAG